MCCGGTLQTMRSMRARPPSTSSVQPRRRAPARRARAGSRSWPAARACRCCPRCRAGAAVAVPGRLPRELGVRGATRPLRVRRRDRQRAMLAPVRLDQRLASSTTMTGARSRRARPRGRHGRPTAAATAGSRCATPASQVTRKPSARAAEVAHRARAVQALRPARSTPDAPRARSSSRPVADDGDAVEMRARRPPGQRRVGPGSSMHRTARRSGSARAVARRSRCRAAAAPGPERPRPGKSCGRSQCSPTNSSAVPAQTARRAGPGRGHAAVGDRGHRGAHEVDAPDAGQPARVAAQRRRQRRVAEPRDPLDQRHLAAAQRAAEEERQPHEHQRRHANAAPPDE